MVKIGDRVETITEYPEEKITGIVKAIYPVLEDKNLLVICTDDGMLVKKYENQVTVIVDPGPEESTITLYDFEEAVSKVTKPTYYPEFEESHAELLSISAVLVCNRLRKELFGEKAEND